MSKTSGSSGSLKEHRLLDLGNPQLAVGHRVCDGLACISAIPFHALQMLCEKLT